MSSLIPPRYELEVIDRRSGRMSREWYKYLVQLGNAINGSPTSADDIAITENTDSMSIESLALHARKTAEDAQGLFLLGSEDLPKTPDVSLLAWWPGDTK